MKKFKIQLGGIKKIDIILFTKHLAVTMKSGLTITEGIEIVIGQTGGKMKKMLTGILQSIKGGETFHHALEAFPKYFSPFYINMIKTSEASGNLEDNLRRLARQLTKADRLKKNIKSAMIYPCFIIVALVGIGFILASFVLPQILPLFKSFDVDLPVTTKALIYIAETFEVRGGQIMFSFAIYIIVTIWLLRQNFMKPLVHRALLYIPTVNDIVIRVNIQRFTSTLSVLLKSGLTIDESLKIIANAMDNRVYRKAVREMIPQIEGGKSIEDAIDNNDKLFPPIVSRMIGVGEKTGSLDDTLEYLGEYYEESVDDTVKNLSSIIEPVLLVFVGLIVGTVAISIVQPMSQLTANIS